MNFLHIFDHKEVLLANLLPKGFSQPFLGEFQDYHGEVNCNATGQHLHLSNGTNAKKVYFYLVVLHSVQINSLYLIKRNLLSRNNAQSLYYSNVQKTENVCLFWCFF